MLDQTYQDFEIVIVDDGSDEPATRHMLISYRRPKTRVIRTENQGVAAARNVGLEASRGRFVSFLDADDVLEQLFLERTLRALESNGSLGFAGCWLRAFGGADFDWAPGRCDFPHLLAEDTVCTPALTRREPLLEVGGFDTQMPVAGYEDWEVAISLVEAAYSGTIVPEYLFRYRVRAGSMTATCTAPENHARLMEYIVDKHQETYQRFLPGVIAVIQRRTADLEGRLDTPPLRPDVAHAGWRDAVLALENHRRALEASALAPEPDTSREAIEWGSLRHLSPVSRVWGLDRGRPVDRYYIEQFLQRHAQDITGRILEVKDATYSSRFGAGVTAIDVVDIASENPDATLVADLGKPGSLPKNRFDCFILTQTVHIVYEAEEVVRNAFRTLRPGGAVLVTLPCVSRIDYESGVDGDFWRFTPASARRLFEGVFGPENVEIESWGNVLACTAFLQGMAQEELHPQELVHNDPYFPLLVTVRAVKPASDGSPLLVRQAEPAQFEVVEVASERWDPPLAGCHVDLPAAGTFLRYPTLDIAGWALTRDGPVGAVELVHEGTVFSTMRSSGARPDLAAVFPHISGAEEAGFRVRTTVLGLEGEVDLEVRVVLRDGERCRIGRVRLSVPAPEKPGAQLAAVFAVGGDQLVQVAGSVTVPVRLAFAVGGAERARPTGHAGIHRLQLIDADHWDLGRDLPGDVGVWLTDGGGDVEVREVLRLVPLVAEAADFAALVAESTAGPPAELGPVSVLNGVSLGNAVVVRHEAVREAGGFDTAAPNPDAAVWDMCIRLALAKRGGATVVGLPPGKSSLAERAGPEGAQWLVEKHADAYAGQMVDVLAGREQGIGETLRSNHALEAMLESSLRPAARALRRERDRLATKLRRHEHGGRPRPEAVRWGDLSRSRPFSDLWGDERGLCIDRYYIERFLDQHRQSIRGTVLDDDVYARRYGGENVARADVLDMDPNNPAATIVADLRRADEIAAGSYDCVILTQTLQLIDETEPAVCELARILKPGGVALISAPCVSRVDPESGLDGDYWRFTEVGLRALLHAAFPAELVKVQPNGNRAAAIAFIQGLAAADVDWIDLDALDRTCPVVLTAVARTPAASS